MAKVKAKPTEAFHEVKIAGKNFSSLLQAVMRRGVRSSFTLGTYLPSSGCFFRTPLLCENLSPVMPKAMAASRVTDNQKGQQENRKQCEVAIREGKPAQQQ